jgi:hypothetical protein
MDKAAIFSDVTKRNALRMANGLPSLDVHAEYAYRVGVAAAGDFRALYERHAGKHATEREIIRRRVLAEYRAQHGLERAQTMAGHWEIERLTKRRFATYIADEYLLSPADRAPSRYTVTYGGGHQEKD